MRPRLLFARLDAVSSATFQIGWSWWAVFFPTWLVMATQVAKLCLTYVTAKALTVGTEGKSEEELTEVCQHAPVVGFDSAKHGNAPGYASR